MSNRVFRMRLFCRYQQPDNVITELTVEQLLEDRWQPFQLDNLSPGFQIFVYAEFACQHTYMRLNCAEQGVALAESEGDILVETNEDWDLRRVRIEFRAKAVSGGLTEARRAHVIERMHRCPVSRNLRELSDDITRFSLS